MYTFKRLTIVVLGVSLGVAVELRSEFFNEYDNQGTSESLMSGQHTLTENKNRLTELAHEYLQFVHDVGSASSVQSTDTRITELFAENLTKIDNRTVLFKDSRQSLLPQMRGFEKEDDPTANKAAWSIDRESPIVVPSIETNSVVINFAWCHMNVGRGTTTVILHCTGENKIEQIIDVWALIKND